MTRSQRALSKAPATLSPDQRPYQPFGGALDLFYCQAPEVLLEGPAGTGKSRSCLEKLHLLACKYAGCRILFVRKTRASMSQSVLVTFEEKVLPAGSPIKEGPQRRMRQSYVYPNGSEIVIAGMDNPLKIMSTEYDIIYVAEATELFENDWESLLTRLRNNVIPYQQLIADCNPDAPTHWLNQRCNRGQTVRVLSRHEDNPSVTEAYLSVLRGLTGVRRARLYEGRWAAAEGLVYDFDRNIHLVDPFPIPREWRRIRAIDLGFQNPFVCQWWAIDGESRMYLYREIYMSQRVVEDHARQIVELSADERYDATVADHDAEDRATLKRYGVPTIAAFKAVQPGIQATQTRLRLDASAPPRPRIYLMRDVLVEQDEVLMDLKKPLCTEQEFDSYIWTKSGQGKAVKEEPVKIDDHGMDTMRYAVAWLDALKKGGSTLPSLPVGTTQRSSWRVR